MNETYTQRIRSLVLQYSQNTHSTVDKNLLDVISDIVEFELNNMESDNDGLKAISEILKLREEVSEKKNESGRDKESTLPQSNNVKH